MTQPVVELNDKTFELMISKKEIKHAIAQMAKEINETYAGKSVILLGVLDGVIMTLARLVKKLEVDVEIELVKLKSYEGMGSTGEVTTLLGMSRDLTDKHVLILEDIIDTGNTLSHLLKTINAQKTASVKIATLLIKEDIFKDKFAVHFKGISIPNRFVVGFGMDYDGKGRQLPEIYAAVD